MEFAELKATLKDFILNMLKDISKILFALGLSLIVAASTSAIAWLLIQLLKKFLLTRIKL